MLFIAGAERGFDTSTIEVLGRKNVVDTEGRQHLSIGPRLRFDPLADFIGPTDGTPGDRLRSGDQGDSVLRSEP
jgi:hypothetical protein